MSNTFEKQPVGHHVAMAWALVNELLLNSPVAVGNSERMRFSLVNAEGCAVTTPDEAVCLFDAQGGKVFLPQTDSDWLDQLMTRFRVGVEWRPDIGAWYAAVAPGTHGYGQTPGVAVVEALVAACRAGCLPVKHPYPGGD